jgi:cell wall assembly regulator SMI1
MTFTNPDHQIDEARIDRCEADCGIRLPRALRSTYLASNGGEPEPYVFQTDEVDTVVSEFLPLESDSRGTAVQSYMRLVRERALVAPHFFPFAVDGGGDYFFVDTSTDDGRVFFYRSDSASTLGLLPLGLNVDEFWAALRPE